jgi:hypothetical protein
MSNFRLGTTLDSALWILKVIAHPLSIVRTTVVFEFSFNDKSIIFAGNFIFLYFILGSLLDAFLLSVPYILNGCIFTLLLSR